jgi:cytochrome c-type biogenesis protein CcmH
MADSSTSPRRPGLATIALALAGLLAVTAVGVALYRSADRGGAETGNASANAMVPQQQAGSTEALAAALRQDPDNDRGWFMLGMSYRGSGRFAEAEQAFRRASELAPNNANYLAYRAEILLANGHDNPPAEATALFRRALAIEPGNPQARYYLATIKDMGGDHRGAIDDLIALIREAPADAPWLEQVRGAAAAIARDNHIDISGRLPPPRTPQGSTAGGAIPGPTPEQMQAARSIPPSQQDQMVRTMVDGLAARLRQNPRDADGWINLMRSRMVLNNPGAAGEALRSGDARPPARRRARSRHSGGVARLQSSVRRSRGED